MKNTCENRSGSAHIVAHHHRAHSHGKGGWWQMVRGAMKTPLKTYENASEKLVGKKDGLLSPSPNTTKSPIAAMGVASQVQVSTRFK